MINITRRARIIDIMRMAKMLRLLWTWSLKSIVRG